jgi:hypothetical protein
MMERQKALKKQRNKYRLSNEYDDDMGNNGGQGPYNQVQDMESTRKLEDPVIVDEESPSSNLMHRQTGKKRRDEQ